MGINAIEMTSLFNIKKDVNYMMQKDHFSLSPDSYFPLQLSTFFCVSSFVFLIFQSWDNRYGLLDLNQSINQSIIFWLLTAHFDI